MEVQTLVVLVIIVVFLLVAIIALVAMFKSGNIFAGDNSICDQTNGFIRGCE